MLMIDSMILNEVYVIDYKTQSNVLLRQQRKRVALWLVLYYLNLITDSSSTYYSLDD